MHTIMTTPAIAPIETPTACPLLNVGFEVAAPEVVSAADTEVAPVVGVLVAVAIVELAARELVNVTDAVWLVEDVVCDAFEVVDCGAGPFTVVVRVV